MPEESIVEESQLPATTDSIKKIATVSSMVFGLRMDQGVPLKIPGTQYDDYHLSASWINQRFIGELNIGTEHLAIDSINLSDLIFDEQVQQLAYLMREVSLRIRKGTLAKPQETPNAEVQI